MEGREDQEDDRRVSFRNNDVVISRQRYKRRNKPCSYDDSAIPPRSRSTASNLKHYRSTGAVNRLGKDFPSSDDLYAIAREVHLKYPQNKKLSQYHSWPKRGGGGNLKQSAIYHNFGLYGSANFDQHNLDNNNPSCDENWGDSVKSSQSLPNQSLSAADYRSSLSTADYSSYKNLSSNNSIKSTTSLNSDPSLAGKVRVGSLVSSVDSLDLLERDEELGVSCDIFKQRTDVMKKWFSEFNDEQKNIFIENILDSCRLPQTHMLSLKMAPALHRGCPDNCQDILQWLPEEIVFHVLDCLDYNSLSAAGQVSKFWARYASHHTLWKKFCSLPELQPTAANHREQLKKYSSNGSPMWRSIFIHRYVCRQNWVHGRCRVKSFVGHTQGVSCVQFDNERIVSGSSDTTIKVWDLVSEQPMLTLVGHSGTVRCLQLMGNRLISGSADTTIKVWDLSRGSDWNVVACRVTMVGHTSTVRCLQVDKEKVISGSYDMTLKVWWLDTGQCKLTLRGHTAAVLCVQYDEEKIISGSADHSIKVWGIYTGACLTTLSGHQNAVTCLQFNRSSIISGSLDCTLKFWDINSGQCIGTIDWIRSEGHTRVVRCLQADSWKIVSAGDDKTLKIWSLKTGERFVTLQHHTDGVTCLQFNENMIVSGSYDKTVKVWDFSAL